MKKLLVIVLVLVLLVIITAAVIISQLDVIVKKGIEHGGQYVFGVPTSVEDVKIQLMDGAFGIHGLVIDNPEGFKSENMLNLDSFQLEINPLSIKDEVIKLGTFELDGLNLTIEQTLKGNNISPILSHLKKFASEEPEPEQEDKPGKPVRVKLDKVSIRNVTATVILPSGLTQTATQTITVPEIELTNVCAGGDNGIPVGQIISRIFPAIIAAVVENSDGLMPDDLIDNLKGDITGLVSELGEEAAGVIDQIGGDTAEMIKEKLPEELGSKLEGILKKPAEKEEIDKRLPLPR